MAKPVAMEVAITSLYPTKDNSRKIRQTDKDLKELAGSIAVQGILQPILCRPHPEKSRAYEIRAGERRWRAARLAGLERVPIIVRELDDVEAMEATIAENAARKDLTPMEEAEAFKRYVDAGNTAAALAKLIGKSGPYVSRRICLTRLSSAWRAAIAKAGAFTGYLKNPFEFWTANHYELIARLPVSQQDATLKNIQNCYCKTWTVGDLDNHIGQSLHRLSAAPWDLVDEQLVKKAGSCSSCHHKISRDPSAWGFKTLPASQDQCLDAGCWKKKMAVALDRALSDALEKHGTGLVAVMTQHGGPRTITGGLNVHYPYDFDSCKKTHKQARPALVVFGPGIGKVRWVKLKKRLLRRVGGPKTAKQSHKDTCKEVDAKRGYRLSEEVFGHQGVVAGPRKITAELSLIDLGALAGVFGLWKPSKLVKNGKEMEVYQRIRKAGKSAAAARELRAIMEAGIRECMYEDVFCFAGTAPEKDAAFVFDLFGWEDLEEIKAKIAEALPYPAAPVKKPKKKAAKKAAKKKGAA